MSLKFRAPPYCESLQSLASTKSIIVCSDARPFNYDGIRSQFRCLFLNSAVHCIFCRNRCSERATGPTTVNGRVGSLKSISTSDEWVGWYKRLLVLVPEPIVHADRATAHRSPMMISNVFKYLM